MTDLTFWSPQKLNPSRDLDHAPDQVCDCLSVCLYAGISQTPHGQILLNFYHILSVAVPWSSLYDSYDMLCTSGFVDDAMLSHNRANGQNQRRREWSVEFARWRHQGEVCRLRLHLVFFGIAWALGRWPPQVGCPQGRNVTTWSPGANILKFSPKKRQFCSQKSTKIYRVFCVIHKILPFRYSLHNAFIVFTAKSKLTVG